MDLCNRMDLCNSIKKLLLFLMKSGTVSTLELLIEEIYKSGVQINPHSWTNSTDAEVDIIAIRVNGAAVINKRSVRGIITGRP